MRLALIFGTRHHERFYDELDYDNIGVSISHGLGFKNSTYYTAYRAPGQLVFAGIIYAIFGHHPLIVEIAEALLLAALPFLCARVGRALGLSPLLANLGATLAAFHPALAYASTTLYPTALTTVALTAGVWFCWQAMQRDRIGLAILAGIALGIAGSATTTFAPLAFLAAMVIVWKRRFKIAALVLVVGMAPALAWMIRNEIVLHDFAIATNGGYNLQLGANDEATPRSGNWVELTPDWTKGEVYLDREEAKEAKAWIHAHRARYAELVVLRAIAVFDSAGKPKTEGLHSGRLADCRLVSAAGNDFRSDRAGGLPEARAHLAYSRCTRPGDPELGDDHRQAALPVSVRSAAVRFRPRRRGPHHRDKAQAVH